MRNFAAAGIQALRPKQWTKNVLVFVGPFAAGIEKFSQLKIVLLSFLAFSIASSIGYIINDLNDIAVDRGHPKKKKRPFASGALNPRSGLLIVGFLVILLLLILNSMNSKFALIIFLYVLNSSIYSIFLKRVPVIEMFTVAMGFVLRLIAGAIALNLIISEWFLIVGGFGALYIVSVKRSAELELGNSQLIREVIRQYSANYLTFVSNISVSVCVTSYCFWAFDQELNAFWYQLSVMPFVLSLFRFAWISDRKLIESPEETILNDRLLLSSASSLITVLSVAIFK